MGSSEARECRSGVYVTDSYKEENQDVAEVSTWTEGAGRVVVILVLSSFQ